MAEPGKWDLQDPPEFEPFWFEIIDDKSYRLWLFENRPTAICVALLYLLFAWLGQKFMSNKRPYQLNIPFVIWNWFIAFVSLFGCFREAQELFYVLKLENGLHRSLCTRSNLNMPVVFWGYMFIAMKFVHYGDTVFLILRKKNLTFLHLYHHCTISICTFYLSFESEPFSRWVASMNFGVHFLVYSYYALYNMGIKLPTIYKMWITGLEIVHFAVGVIVNTYTIVLLVQGEECARTWTSVKIQSSVGGGFFLQFIYFFYKRYLSKSKSD